MKRSDYRAGVLDEAAVRPEGERTLVFVRELRFPPHEVWKALTDPGQLAQWAPFDADRDLGTVGEATLTMAGGGGDEKAAGKVTRAEPPRLLEYTWGADLLRWELESIPGGTRLTLRHTVEDRSWLPKVTAGWQICLDVADRLLAGQPIGRIVAGEALNHGWSELNAAYAVRWGIPVG